MCKGKALTRGGDKMSCLKECRELMWRGLLLPSVNPIEMMGGGNGGVDGPLIDDDEV